MAAPPRLVRVASRLRGVARRPRAPSIPAAAARPATSSLQLYTSGTTGVPKGVLTTHRNLAACAETSPYWQFDRDSAQPDAAADVPHRRHRLGVPRPLERRDDDPRAATSTPRRCSTCSSSERVTNAIFVPTMLQMLTAVPGRGRPRLLGAALDRLRRVADHHAGVEGGAAHVRLRALRRLRADGDDGRGRAARARGPRPDGPREHLLRSAGRPLPVGRAPDRRPGDRRRTRPARGRRGVVARART